MTPIPQKLKIVAWLFIINGVFSAMDVVFNLLLHHINLNLGVLTIFVGQGLLRLNPRSLTWAMFFTWLGLIFTPIGALLFLLTPGNLKIWGMSAGQAPPGLGFILSVAAFALAYWQYGVLTNRGIRELFVS